jgi:secondary thiamine-phosphate synthase enzyme
MRQYQQVLKLQTTGKSLCRVTQKVQAIVAESQMQTGLCTLFLRHTSASLVIQENADPDVLKDLENFFAKLVPEWENYIHSTEGPDDMPAHIRTTLTHTSKQIPIAPTVAFFSAPSKAFTCGNIANTVTSASWWFT